MLRNRTLYLWCYHPSSPSLCRIVKWDVKGIGTPCLFHPCHPEGTLKGYWGLWIFWGRLEILRFILKAGWGWWTLNSDVNSSCLEFDAVCNLLVTGSVFNFNCFIALLFFYELLIIIFGKLDKLWTYLWLCFDHCWRWSFESLGKKKMKLLKNEIYLIAETWSFHVLILFMADIRRCLKIIIIFFNEVLYSFILYALVVNVR